MSSKKVEETVVLVQAAPYGFFTANGPAYRNFKTLATAAEPSQGLLPTPILQMNPPKLPVQLTANTWLKIATW